LVEHLANASEGPFVAPATVQPRIGDDRIGSDTAFAVTRDEGVVPTIAVETGE
jgi:hypothetical protein